MCDIRGPRVMVWCFSIEYPRVVLEGAVRAEQMADTMFDEVGVCSCSQEGGVCEKEPRCCSSRIGWDTAGKSPKLLVRFHFSRHTFVE